MPLLLQPPRALGSSGTSRNFRQPDEGRVFISITVSIGVWLVNEIRDEHGEVRILTDRYLLSVTHKLELSSREW